MAIRQTACSKPLAYAPTFSSDLLILLAATKRIAFYLPVLARFAINFISTAFDALSSKELHRTCQSLALAYMEAVATLGTAVSTTTGDAKAGKLAALICHLALSSVVWFLTLPARVLFQLLFRSTGRNYRAVPRPTFSQLSTVLSDHHPRVRTAPHK